MTREEAAKELQSYADSSWGGLNEAFEMAIAVLREPRWISVDDSLPEPGKRVLVCREGCFEGDRYIGIDTRIHTDSVLKGAEWEGNLRSWKSMVTHWMPLPEPPEEDE